MPSCANINNAELSTESDIDEDGDDDTLDPDYTGGTSSSSSFEEFSVSHIVSNVGKTTVYKGRPKKGRKRKYEHQNEKIRKSLKNSNMPYVSKRGTKVPSKEFVDYHCSCIEKCYEKVAVDARKSLFDKFWNLGSYDLQTTFICTLVKENQVNRKRKNNGIRNRAFTRNYFLGETVVVCREMFVKTIGISTKRVNTALIKARTLTIKDNRGQHGNHRRISIDRRKEIIEHINTIPKYKSHYRRTQTEREYLPPHMTIELMYNLYKTECAAPVSLSFYKHIFYTEFNITRKTLKKDTCNKCDTYVSQLSTATGVEHQSLEENYKQHLEAAEIARQKMNSDFKRAKDDTNIETLSFDLEKTLPMPRIPTNIIFYKRQLWLYNLGIHTGKKNQGHCFIWPEGTAGRGAQEVGSCITKFGKMYLQKDIKELILWSDSCGGQNRNIKLTLMLKHMLHHHPSLTRVYIRFLVSGHSFLLNDSDFGDIEKCLKLQQRLYTPDDYAKVMKTCRKRNPFVVTVMEKTDFKSSATLENMVINRKKDIVGEKVNWLQVREIKIEKCQPYSLFFKYSHNDTDDYIEVDIKPKQKGKQNLTFNLEMELLWPEGKPISPLKLNDIKSVMHLIPEVDQHFYKTLISDDAIIDDIDGYNGPIDFEFEEQC